MEVQIKQATIEQIDQLMKWRMEVLSEVFEDWKQENQSDLYEANLKYYNEMLISENHIAVFAKVGGVTVGCGGICIYQEMPSPDNPSGYCAYLMNIYTRKEFRGQGIATQVVKYLIRQVRERNIDKIYLETSERGRILYEKLGFENMVDYMKLPKEVKL